MSEGKFISDEEQAGLLEIQRLLDEAYEHYFATTDGHSKPAEGFMSLGFNNFFQRRDGDPLRITSVEIYSYVLGTSRQHSFPSVAEALETVKDWHADEMANEGGGWWK